MQWEVRYNLKTYIIFSITCTPCHLTFSSNYVNVFRALDVTEGPLVVRSPVLWPAISLVLSVTKRPFCDSLETDEIYELKKILTIFLHDNAHPPNSCHFSYRVHAAPTTPTTVTKTFLPSPETASSYLLLPSSSLWISIPYLLPLGHVSLSLFIPWCIIISLFLPMEHHLPAHLSWSRAARSRA